MSKETVCANIHDQDYDGVVDSTPLEAEKVVEMSLAAGVGNMSVVEKTVDILADNNRVEESVQNDMDSDDAGSEGSDTDTELPQGTATVDASKTGTVTNATEAPDSEFVCPDDDLVAKILAQVEYYFSDENIVTDGYLLKHIKRNKQGFVSIKVIMSFRKMKKLSRDPRVVAYALCRSQKLQVNEPGTKVRRIDPLPDAAPPSKEPEVDTSLRTVIATNLGMENPSMDAVGELFSKCGRISQVRIIRPGSAVPANMKKHVEKRQNIGATSVYALVEYEELSSAVNACKILTNTSDWRRGMSVMMLVKPTKKDGRNDTGKNTELKGSADNRPYDSDGADVAEAKKKKKKKRNSRVFELAQEDSPYSSSGSDIDRRKSPCRDGTSNSSKTSLNSQKLGEGGSTKTRPAAGSAKSSPKQSPTAVRRGGNMYGRSPLAHDSDHEDWRARSSSFGAELSQSQNPWIQKRLKAKQETGLSPGSSPLLCRRAGEGGSVQDSGDFLRKADSDRVLRQPRGPDGTKGFKGTRMSVSVN